MTAAGNEGFSEVSEASLAMRRQRATLKQRARASEITFGEVVLGHAEAIGPTRFADVIQWGWPRMGPVRQITIGRAAAREDINVLLPINKASRATRTRFVNLVGEIRGERMEASSTVLVEDTTGEEKRLSWLLERAEKERDAALARVVELERLVGTAQVVMPTIEAERMLADLADAVETHKRSVKSGTWDGIDERLWQEKDSILMSGAPALQAVA